MSRYINADARDNTSTSRVTPPTYKPTADVVEVVRCKDCAKKEYCRTSNVWTISPSDDWFCADGERREDE